MNAIAEETGFIIVKTCSVKDDASHPLFKPTTRQKQTSQNSRATGFWRLKALNDGYEDYRFYLFAYFGSNLNRRSLTSKAILFWVAFRKHASRGAVVKNNL
jgi:hypothetical protein